MEEKILAFLKDWKHNRLRNHLLFWGFSILFYLFFEYLYGDDIKEGLLIKLFYLPTQICATYFLSYYQIPRFLLRKKFLGFFLSIILSTYLLTVISRFMIVYGLETVLNASEPKDSPWSIITDLKALLGQYVLFLYLTPIFFIILKFAKDAILLRSNISTLQAERNDAEIKFLRSQVHPHFLFNTLNNIYILLLSGDKEATPVIKKMGDIMAFMESCSRRNFVSLKEEVQLLENYIDLQLIRFGNRIQFEFEKHFDKNLKIAPLILLSFVENAFKHGVSTDPDSPELSINIETKGKHLYFKVYNSKVIKISKDENDYRSGIGSKNARRQLDIIYPKKYNYDIEETEKSFQVDLTIELF